MPTCTDVDGFGDHNFVVVSKEEKKNRVEEISNSDTHTEEPLLIYCTYCGRVKEIKVN